MFGPGLVTVLDQLYLSMTSSCEEQKGSTDRYFLSAFHQLFQRKDAIIVWTIFGTEYQSQII
jgi:hypothetical protein